MTAFGIWLFGTFYRYYFYGKISAYWQQLYSKEEWERRAQLNKR